MISGIPFSFRTRSAVGETALCVARQSIYFDLFAALLNIGITPPPKWHSDTSDVHETLARFLHSGAIVKSLFGSQGALFEDSHAPSAGPPSGEGLRYAEARKGSKA